MPSFAGVSRCAPLKNSSPVTSSKLGRQSPRARIPRTRITATLAPAVQHLQNRLQQHLATHVLLHHGEKRGRIEIEYYGNDDLQRILGVLGMKDE